VLVIALLIAPGTQHRLTCNGQITPRLQRTATVFAGCALLPFALSLGLDVYVVLQKVFGTGIGIAAGVCLGALALFFWYGLEFGYTGLKMKKPRMDDPKEYKPTSLEVRIDQMLTEARVAIPGAQALLGFQLLVAMNSVFAKLPPSSQLIHALALGCVALALVLLVAPAAFHRLAFGGEDTEDVFRVGAALVTSALLPLALGIAGDIYVAITRIANSSAVGVGAAVLSLLVFLGFWYVQPILLRSRARA
jgi:hypothetical protein